MISWLDKIDTSLFHFLNGSISNPLFDLIMPIITDQDLWVIPILLLIGWLIIKGGKRGRIAVGALILAFLLTDIIAAQIIKPYFGRLRPSHAMTESINLLVSKGGKFSFVSNHAANSFCLATILSYFFSQWKNKLYVLSGVIAFSRVYVGVHYPGDIIFGGLFGYGMAWMVLSLWVILKMKEIKRGRSWILYE